MEKRMPLGLLPLALAFLVLAVGAEARAQGPDRSTIFSRIDRNGDGTVTTQEFGAAPKVRKDPVGGRQAFLRMDRDGSRTLSRREFVAGPGGPGGGSPSRPPARQPGQGSSSGQGSSRPQPDEDEPVPTDPSLDVLPEDVVPDDPLPELKPDPADDPEPGPTPAPAAGRVDLG
jgi:hypothetical protein